MSDNLIGKVLGNYRIDHPLGEGGMGIVYAGTDLDLERRVAIKVLPPSLGRSESYQKRFQREARLAASLSHPNIVTIHGVGQSEDARYLVMEHVEGETLYNLLKRKGRLDIPTALEILGQTAAGLSHAHERGIIHRDIKPRNIMLNRDRQVKILDFGLAKLTDEETAKYTEVGNILGTIPYMSPEQCMGSELGPASDVFSLFVVLYEMLAGRRPFAGPNAAAVIKQITEANPEPVNVLNESVPNGLTTMIRKGLTKVSAGRYQNCRALIHDLNALLAAESIAVAPRVNWGIADLGGDSSVITRRIPVLSASDGDDALSGPSPQEDRPPDPQDHSKLIEAIRHFNGTTGQLNMEQARRLFVEAAEAENPVARIWLAVLHHDGACHVEISRALAKSIGAANIGKVEALAQTGDAEASCAFAMACERGIPSEQNLRQAAWHYREAANHGHAEATYRLGCLVRSDGILRDDKQAAQWLTQAARLGHVQAIRTVGLLYLNGIIVRRNLKEGLGLLEIASERGDREAQFQLGLHLLRGGDGGAALDETGARRWFAKAADEDHSDAMFNLAAMLEKGRGGEREPAQALEWYKKAATLGLQEAQQELMERGLKW